MIILSPSHSILLHFHSFLFSFFSSLYSSTLCFFISLFQLPIRLLLLLLFSLAPTPFVHCFRHFLYSLSLYPFYFVSLLYSSSTSFCLLYHFSIPLFSFSLFSVSLFQFFLFFFIFIYLSVSPPSRYQKHFQKTRLYIGPY